MPDTMRQETPLTLATSDRDRVFHGICDLLKPFNRHHLELRTDTVIMGDLEIDSVAIFDLVMEIEDNYEVTFPMEMISEIKTIGDLTQAIHSVSN